MKDAMPNQTFLLRIEGVNLSNVIDDTDQLSVRRGGGLMILNAAAELLSLLKQETRDRLTEVATGASIGLFRFDALDEADAEIVRLEAETAIAGGSLIYRKMLSKHRYESSDSSLPLKHGTFVVDVTPIENAGEAQHAEQLAVAKNRWRQLQQPTLSLDDVWVTGQSEPCSLNRTRVATTTHNINDDNQQSPVCLSALDRWHYGRGARQKFYHKELGPVARENPNFAATLANLEFTNDLQELSASVADIEQGGSGAATVPDNLADKIAVFYVDGNGFGQKGRDILQAGGLDPYREWSNALRNHHRHLLMGLVSLTDNDILWKNADQIRLETLLWGGDEILWVVPAWKGWEVAKWFFSQPHEIHLPGQTEPEKLTYGCGMVFCHAKAPIKNVTALAHRLGDVAKTARQTQNVHRLAYEVLESFDDISGDLDAHRKRFLPPNYPVTDLVIDPGELKTQWTTLNEFARCSEFPMRQLYSLTAKWRKQQDNANERNRIQRVCDDSKLNSQGLLTAFKDPVGWLHLLQMLPYLPVSDGSREGDAS